MIIRTLAASAVLMTAAGTASAQSADRCSDVLRDGTFQTSSYRENSYFQQIIWSRFLSSSFQQSKTDRALGFGVPVGEIVLGGDYNEATFNQKKADIRREMSSTVTAANEIDVALASGDQAIVGAWSQCMSQRGGYVSLRMTPISATQAFAAISWSPGLAGSHTGVEATTLEEDFQLPEGMTFSAGAQCFRAGRVLRANPCRATINLPSAKSDLALSVNAEHGSAEAYLPPRMVLIRETRPFIVQPAHRLNRTAFREEKRVAGEITLTTEEIEAGWRLNPASASVRVEIINEGHWVHDCNQPKWEADLYSFRYDYRMFASQRNSPERNISIHCQVHPSINMSRDRWVALGSQQ